MSRKSSHSARPFPVRRSSFFFAWALVFCLGLTPIACAQWSEPADPSPATQQPRASALLLPSFADVVDKVLPAVVNIKAVQASRAVEEEGGSDGNMPDFGQGLPPALEEFLRRFFGEQGPFGIPSEPGSATRLTALGSGFIIDPAGYVVTDSHVIANAEQITVVLQDNSRYPAKIVGTDDVSDLALLKIEVGRPLPSVAWGDSDAARVGDWILAVGNPFGLGGTVSAGIISARGREIPCRPL